MTGRPTRTRLRLGALDGGTYYHHRSLTEPPLAAFFDALVYLRDVPTVDLSQFETFIIPCRTNPIYLRALAPQLKDFMRAGGRLVVMGETFPDTFLPDIAFRPMPTNYWWWLDPSADLGVRMSDEAHDINHYLDAKAATWHLHGTFHPLAPTQRSLIETREGESILFEDRQAFAPGTLIATSLDPFFHHGSHFMPATTTFLNGFLAWLTSPTQQQGAT